MILPHSHSPPYAVFAELRTYLGAQSSILEPAELELRSGCAVIRHLTCSQRKFARPRLKLAKQCAIYDWNDLRE